MKNTLYLIWRSIQLVLQGWKPFFPSERHIGKSGLFLQIGIFHKEYQENQALGAIKKDCDPYPWHYNVYIETITGLRLPISNGKRPFYDTINNRHYMPVPKWKYFYKKIYR